MRQPETRRTGATDSARSQIQQPPSRRISTNDTACVMACSGKCPWQCPVPIGVALVELIATLEAAA